MSSFYSAPLSGVAVQGPQGIPGEQGPPGAPGAPGTPGAAGVDGKTIRYGLVDPTTEGVDGDFYINTVDNKIFGPKANGVWPAGVALSSSSFLQTGTGAVKRTVENKLREPYVSIADYGAVSGSLQAAVATANGNAIQAAINAAISSGIRAVFVPAGVWWSNKPLTISSDITFFGVGANTVNGGAKSEIRFLANTSASDGLNGTTGLKTAITVSSGSSTKIYNFVLRDLSFSAQSSTLEGRDITGLRLSELSDSRIHNCAFTGFDKTLALEGCSRMIIAHNHFGLFARTTSKPTYVISLRDSTYSTTNCTGNHFTDNEIRGTETCTISKVFEIVSSDALYLNHNHMVSYDIGLYIKSRSSGVSGVGDIHSANQYYDACYLHCVLVESEAGDSIIRDLAFSNDYFRGGQEGVNPMIKINNDPAHNVITSITFDSCRIADCKGGPGIAITNPVPQVRNLNIKDCEFRQMNRSSLSASYNFAHVCAINASITGNIFDAQDTTYLSGSGATNGKCVVVSEGTGRYVFSDNTFYTSSSSHDVVTLPAVEGRQVFGNIHNNKYLDNYGGPISNLKEIISGAYYPVVAQTDIGSAPNQVPLNSMLGTMAFQDAEGVAVDRAVVGALNASKLPTYASDAAAGTGGLVAGDVYKTSTGELRIKL